MLRMDTIQTHKAEEIKESWTETDLINLLSQRKTENHSSVNSIECQARWRAGTQQDKFITSVGD